MNKKHCIERKLQRLREMSVYGMYVPEKWIVEIYNSKVEGKIEKKVFDNYMEAKLFFNFAGGRILYREQQEEKKMEIKKDTTTIMDTMDRLIEKDGNITCGCGNPKLREVSFLDGFDWYSNTYQCDCGNVINVNGKRSVSW